MNLKNRHFLTLKDYSKEEIRYLLDLAHQLKADKKAAKKEEEKEVEKEHVCPECGKIEPPEARFCTKCGHKF